MKTSLGHLPQRKAEELEILTKYIRRAVPAQMVILFGSYARGNWVELDERFDYGVHTTFQSDYDILVLVEHGVEPYGAARKLDRVEDVFARNTRSDTPVSFILEHIQTFNISQKVGISGRTSPRKESCCTTAESLRSKHRAN